MYLVGCFPKRYHKKTPNTKGAKKVEHCCKFCIPIYYCSKVKRWYFRKNSGAHFTHNDHGPTPRKLTRVGARNVPKADLDFAIDLLNKNMPKAMVNLVLNIKGGNKMSQGALDYLRRSVLMKQHGTKDGDSTATRLLRMLDDKGATYRYITGSYSEATKLVRIKKHTSKAYTLLGASLAQNIYIPTTSTLATKVINFKVQPFYCIFG